MADASAMLFNYARISSANCSGISLRAPRLKAPAVQTFNESRLRVVSAHVVRQASLGKNACAEPRLGWLNASHAGNLRPSYAWTSGRSQITKLSAVSGGDRLPQGSAEEASDGKEGAPPSLMQKMLPFLPVVGIILLGLAIYGIQEFLMPEGMDINSFLQGGKETFVSMGLMGYFYYFLLYTVLEVLCIPAAPLTASAGYIFGFLPGFLIISTASTFAAAIAFLLARSVLRPWVEHRVAEFPLFRVIDKIIGREGLKVVFLLRLSPLMPFAISNYLYGLTAVKLWEYVVGTWLGYVRAQSCVCARVVPLDTSTRQSCMHRLDCQHRPVYSSIVTAMHVSMGKPAQASLL
eukprot:jgi/Mesvir1/21880/Mv01949-RA.1